MATQEFVILSITLPFCIPIGFLLGYFGTHFLTKAIYRVTTRRK